MCINFIGDVDCSHKAQILQLTTQEKKNVLKDLSQSLMSSSKCLQAFRMTSFTSTNALHVRRAECELAPSKSMKCFLKLASRRSPKYYS